MFFILGVGWGAHLALLPYGGDYPSILRLAQMIAYPFLLLAPQRFIAQPVESLSEIRAGQSLLETNSADVETAASASANVYAHPAIWDAFKLQPATQWQ